MVRILRKASRILGREEEKYIGLPTIVAHHYHDCAGSYLPNLFQQLVIVLEFPGDMGQQTSVILGKHHLRHAAPKKLRHKHASSWSGGRKDKVIAQFT